ncbi:hypothetical protein ASG43_02000 [Aureimonas sp. Leaf454]|uniref:hypothetical protein n=1 Tax=Aureimonas sp. Leaf454 TaxID=1736381 RepID=UPI0006F89C35|nr:hypothetical protein [Aureimonas sp. Leaf454]KQT54400.1 hypothetical protein ASG43_02000 [Aureimonas sp. Leaf454]
MSTSNAGDDDDLATIQNLVMELASEVDMHYDAFDGLAIRQTVAAIAAGRLLLQRRGRIVSDDVDAILEKFSLANRPDASVVALVSNGNRTRH